MLNFLLIYLGVAYNLWCEPLWFKLSDYYHYLIGFITIQIKSHMLVFDDAMVSVSKVGEDMSEDNAWSSQWRKKQTLLDGAYCHWGRENWCGVYFGQIQQLQQVIFNKWIHTRSYNQATFLTTKEKHALDGYNLTNALRRLKKSKWRPYPVIPLFEG